MISYNNSAPKAVNNVGQFGATEGSIGAYKSAAEYAADAKYWALLSQARYTSIDDILAEVERLYAQGLLLESDIQQLKSDFEEQNQTLLGLIQSTEAAIDNTNAATELSKEATQEVLAQLDIISNMTVQTSLLPPGSMATGSYNNATGVFSFGIPEGQPGRDGTDGTISDIGNVAIGTPVPDDYGFYVDSEDGGLYRASMTEIANLVPSIRSISINGGEEQTGAVSFNSVSSFNTRTGVVMPASGDYSVNQITGAAASGANSDITSLTGLTTAITIAQGGTGGKTFSEAKTNLRIDRLVQQTATNQETQLLSGDGNKQIFINNTGNWGVYDKTANRMIGLAVGQGGTGAVTVTGARSNLGVDRLDQSVPGDTRIISSDASKRLYVKDAGEWGCFDVTAGTFKPLGVAQGGTGASTAEAARTNLGLGLVATESIVPVTKGGTGATSPENARLSLVSAKSGDNSDITSLTGLTTALSVSQGGTGAKTAEGARASLSAAKTGDNSDINRLSGLTSISGMSPNLELRGVNSGEGHGNGVIYESSDPVEASFGIANIGGGSAVFHNYAKPADGSGIENGALIGGYGSRPWTGTAYTSHSNVSQHFLMDGKSSSTNHGGWFRLLTTPLNKTDADRRQTFATSNNGDLYAGFDVPMGMYSLSKFGGFNGMTDQDGRGFKQINNTANEIALITPRNGATANINFRGVTFNGSMTGAKGATQPGDNMWLSFAGHDGVKFTGAAAGIRIKADSGWSTTNLQSGITFATTAQGSTTRIDRWSVASDGNLSPAQDNTYAIGSGVSRVTSIFATNGAIQTSDARMKTEVRAMTSQELSAAKEIAKEVGFFKWLERVETEGEMARWHTGITVQRVIEIMEKNGLDAVKYGIVCHDIWDESVNISADPDDESKTVETIIPAGDRYSLRYSELNVFIARGLEQRISELEEKLSQ